MAHVAENPIMHNTGVRGVDTVLRNLTSIFGPRANAIMDPHALRKHSAYLMPHSYVDDERYLTTTFINAMDQMPDWWRVVAGVVDERTINIALKIWVQKRVVAQFTAPGAPADISQQTQEIRNFTLQRIQTDFKFMNENFQFGGPDGTKEVEMKLGAVKAAVEAAYIRQLLEALFFEKDWYRLFKARYGSRSVRTVEDAIRWVQDVTFFIQKGGLRMWAEVFGLVRDAIRDAGGVPPDTWIVPNGVKLKSSIQAYDAVEYSRRGQLTFPYLENLDKALDIFHGVRVVESPPIKVENEREPIDPLRAIMRLGNYIKMTTTTRNANLDRYKTYKRDVDAYSRTSDNERTRVSLYDALPHLHRWGSDGYLADDHYELAENLRQEMLNMGFMVPEDENEQIQADMFIYKHESGDYKVADVFGHMEPFYLDSSDVREMVESGYNSFDKILSADDKKALAEGEKLMNDLYMYDPLNSAAALFRYAVFLSNQDGVDPATGLVRANIFGFAENLPTVEQRTGDNQFVLRTPGGQYIGLDNNGNAIGVGQDIAAAEGQSVRPMPYGMGSIPGMRTLADLARSPPGSPGRKGYDDNILNIARNYDVALLKIYNEMVNHFEEGHISLNEDRVPEFFKSRVPVNNRITLFAAQHMDTPKYPFFMSDGAAAPVPEITLQSEENRVARIRENIAMLRDTENSEFLLSFLKNDRTFGLLVSKIREIYKMSFAEFYQQFIEGKRQEQVVTILNAVAQKLRDKGASCTGLTDNNFRSVRLVFSQNQFERNEVWEANLRPRSVGCPHSIFENELGQSNIEAFRQSDEDRGDVSFSNVLGTYVVNKETKPYSPALDTLGPIKGMDIEAMQFDIFEQQKAAGTSDDKQYTGATSTNLERKYREVSNRYSSLTVHRAYGQMILLAMTTYQQFERFLQNDVVFPADVLIIRPEIEYEVKAIVPIKGGGDTVNIHRAASNFLFENRGIARETAASFAQYMLAIVKDTRNYTIINGGWCTRYVRGEGLDALNHKNMNVVTGEFGGSALYMLLPYRSSKGRPGLKTKVEETQFLTGRLDETYWDAEVADELSYAGYKWGSTVQPSAVYYSFIFGFHEIAAQMHISEQTHHPSQAPPINNLILENQYYVWNEGTGDWSTKIKNKDVFGEDGVYTGCGRDRDGNLFKCAHARDNC